jgi:3-hydroxyisobutyrate dehydrogenase
MGMPICARLTAAGLRVIATDRRSEVREASQAINAEWVDSIPRLAAAADVVITILPGPGEIRETSGPLLDNLRDGSAWIDMTSATPSISHEITERAANRIRILDCPVGGSPEAARGGRLLGYVGGSFDDLATHRWLLELVCEAIVHVGPAGTGYAVKLLTNLLWFGQAVATAEVLSLVTRLELDPEAVRMAITRGPATSRFIEEDAPALLRGEVMDSFPVARCAEELTGVLQIAEDLGLRLPIAERVAELYEQAADHYGDADGELLAAHLVADRLGVRFADPAAQYTPGS